MAGFRIIILKLSLSIFLFLLLPVLKAQTTTDILAAYEAFSELPREVAYIHLNKSTLIRGESLAFKGYVLKKENGYPSRESTNLYCVIEDENGKRIKGSLIFTGNGFGSGEISIDSTFTTGTYVFKAYTNYMRNFDEPNYFSQEIEIIDPGAVSDFTQSPARKSFDVQILPEGGHLLANALNTLGVIAVSETGEELEGINGRLVDENNTVINTFRLNRSGLAKFAFEPGYGANYFVKLSFDGREHTFALVPAEKRGINLQLNRLENSVILSFGTNTETLPTLRGQEFRLAIHNGSSYKETSFTFDDKTQVLKNISLADLLQGMNIFTVFNEKGQPILERLYFNHEGTYFLKGENPVIHKNNEGVSLKIAFPGINKDSINSFSASILPSGTASYNNPSNLSSHFHLKPYLRGPVRNPGYYFTEVDPVKKYELDLLLLTQGWSSYKWNTIFEGPPTVNYQPEYGLNYEVVLNNSKTREFIIYPNLTSTTELISLDDNEASFVKKGFFPFEDETLQIGSVKENSKVEKAGLYIRFYPSAIPQFPDNPDLRDKLVYSTEKDIVFTEVEGFRDIETLDTVMLRGRKAQTREDLIERRALGRVEFFDKEKRFQYRYLSVYLSAQGYQVDDFLDFSIRARNPTFFNNPTPIIFLDDVLLSDLSILNRFPMENVDYIEINKSGMGGGIRGGSGIIRIVTDPLSRSDTPKKSDPHNSYSIPLTFSKPKRYTPPVYADYDSDFFKSYGVVDWIPNLMFDENGELWIPLSVKPGLDSYYVFIEGVDHRGAIFSKKIEVDLSTSN